MYIPWSVTVPAAVTVAGIGVAAGAGLVLLVVRRGETWARAAPWVLSSAIVLALVLAGTGAAHFSTSPSHEIVSLAGYGGAVGSILILGTLRLGGGTHTQEQIQQFRQRARLTLAASVVLEVAWQFAVYWFFTR